MKQNEEGRATWTIVGVVAAVAVVVGLAYYVATGPPKDVRGHEDGGPGVGGPEAPPVGEVKVSVPFEQGGKVEWREETKPATSKDPVVDAVNRFFVASNIAPDARLVKTTRDGANLRLDFSNLFTRGYGTDDEQVLLEGIFRAVRDNSDAETVEFFEDGSPAQGLGNLELEGPQTVPR